MEDTQRLTKAEKKELRKAEWQNATEKEKKQAQYKKIGIWAGVSAIIFLAIFGLAMLVNSSPSSSSTIKSDINAPTVTKNDIKTGNPQAKVTLIEYSDFQCPACAAFHPFVNQLLSEEKGKIQFVYRYFPLVNAHPNAHISAQAAFAASLQGKFWQMSDLLFNNQTDWAPLQNPQDTFVNYAKELKIDTTKFKADMNSNEAYKTVEDSLNSAISIGLNSTPSFILNGKLITNPTNYTDFKKLIDDELNKK